ncbi:unnamed protein product [Cuscuta europaea]|uniref:Protein kinase domain-containing protein n=1 Tax=Cuscuta europaea TaxID=41803 RepID=A0A9P1E1F9_CUSEU|nr:unnamed protein product [Cuscuta europaea]
MGISMVKPMKLARGLFQGQETRPSSSTAGEPTTNSAAGLGEQRVPDPKAFTFMELKAATGNFGAENVVGEGEYGILFKGWVDQKTLAPSSQPGTGMAVAVRILSRRMLRPINQETEYEVKGWAQFQHKNIVRLIGYCLDDSTQHLMVHEFIGTGSTLHNHLFERDDRLMELWSIRIRLAVDVARGLCYLHGLNGNVFYGDLKPTHIFLDSDYTAKLSDVGIKGISIFYNRQGSSIGHAHAMTIPETAYMSPEHCQTGTCTKKSDVYCFGMVLLELLSGRSMSSIHPQYRWQPLRKKSIIQIMDPRIRCYPMKEAKVAVSIAYKCIQVNPGERPLMADVLSNLTRIVY